jgi:hypothetical protein
MQAIKSGAVELTGRRSLLNMFARVFAPPVATTSSPVT